MPVKIRETTPRVEILLRQIDVLLGKFDADVRTKVGDDLVDYISTAEIPNMVEIHERCLDIHQKKTIPSLRKARTILKHRLVEMKKAEKYLKAMGIPGTRSMRCREFKPLGTINYGTGEISSKITAGLWYKEYSEGSNLDGQKVFVEPYTWLGLNARAGLFRQVRGLSTFSLPFEFFAAGIIYALLRGQLSDDPDSDDYWQWKVCALMSLPGNERANPDCLDGYESDEPSFSRGYTMSDISDDEDTDDENFLCDSWINHLPIYEREDTPQNDESEDDEEPANFPGLLQAPRGAPLRAPLRALLPGGKPRVHNQKPKYSKNDKNNKTPNQQTGEGSGQQTIAPGSTKAKKNNKTHRTSKKSGEGSEYQPEFASASTKAKKDNNTNGTSGEKATAVKHPLDDRDEDNNNDSDSEPESDGELSEADPDFEAEPSKKRKYFDKPLDKSEGTKKQKKNNRKATWTVVCTNILMCPNRPCPRKRKPFKKQLMLNTHIAKFHTDDKAKDSSKNVEAEGPDDDNSDLSDVSENDERAPQQENQGIVESIDNNSEREENSNRAIGINDEREENSNRLYQAPYSSSGRPLIRKRADLIETDSDEGDEELQTPAREETSQEVMIQERAETPARGESSERSLYSVEGDRLERERSAQEDEDFFGQSLDIEDGSDDEGLQGLARKFGNMG